MLTCTGHCNTQVAVLQWHVNGFACGPLRCPQRTSSGWLAHDTVCSDSTCVQTWPSEAWYTGLQCTADVLLQIAARDTATNAIMIQKLPLRPTNQGWVRTHTLLLACARVSSDVCCRQEALSMIWAHDCADLGNLHFLAAAEVTHDAGM